MVKVLFVCPGNVKSAMPHLNIPVLRLQLIHINMRPGHFPSTEETGISWLNMPLNVL